MSKARVIQGFLPASHDHDACIDAALTRAMEVLEQRGGRFTELRKTVLELVWRSHRPIKAYEVVEALGASGRNSAPPTAYRALEFLQGEGLVHKVESINAYVGCSDPLAQHTTHFLICTDCGNVAEVVDEVIDDRIYKTARRLQFEVHDRTVEVSGVCGACKRASAHRPGSD